MVILRRKNFAFFGSIAKNWNAAGNAFKSVKGAGFKGGMKNIGTGLWEGSKAVGKVGVPLAAGAAIYGTKKTADVVTGSI